MLEKNNNYLNPAIIKHDVESRGYVLDSDWVKWFMKYKITKYELKQLKLQDLYIDDWMDKNKGAPVKIKESPNYKYLCGDKKYYIMRCKNEPSHSCEAFDELIKKFENEGVNPKNIICVDGDNHIVDGAHRASWLAYKYGEDYMITVLKLFLFKKTGVR